MNKLGKLIFAIFCILLVALSFLPAVLSANNSVSLNAYWVVNGQPNPQLNELRVDEGDLMNVWVRVRSDNNFKLTIDILNSNNGFVRQAVSRDRPKAINPSYINTLAVSTNDLNGDYVLSVKTRNQVTGETSRKILNFHVEAVQGIAHIIPNEPILVGFVYEDKEDEDLGGEDFVRGEPIHAANYDPDFWIHDGFVVVEPTYAANYDQDFWIHDGFIFTPPLIGGNDFPDMPNLPDIPDLSDALEDSGEPINDVEPEVPVVPENSGEPINDVEPKVPVVPENSGEPINDGGPDADDDGLLDFEDNCPYAYNPDQKDSDGNGVGDVCEPINDVEPKVPVVPENSGEPINDGGPDADDDGLLDFEDNCPHVYNPDQKDSDGNGVGEVCGSIDNEEPVEEPNHQPIVNVPNHLDVKEGQTIAFIVTARDEDGDDLKLYVKEDYDNGLYYLFKKIMELFFGVQLPEGAFFDANNGEFKFSPRYDYVKHQESRKDITLQFVAKDDEDNSGWQTIVITVHDVNQLPVIGPLADVEAYVGDLVEIVVQASDADEEDILTFASDLKLVNSEWDDNIFSWVPLSGQVGEYQFTFIVSDGVAIVEKTIKVSIKERGVVLKPQPEPQPEPQDDNEGNLIFASVRVGSEVAQPGESIVVGISLRNSGDADLENLRIKAIIPDLGLSREILILNLKAGDSTYREIILNIPDQAESGDRIIRLTADGENIHETAHRYVTIV